MSREAAYQVEEETERLVLFLREQCGYTNIRVLPDGIVCVRKMLYTYAVIIDPDFHGHSGRYCYATERQANACADAMKSVDDPPLPDGLTANKRAGHDG